MRKRLKRCYGILGLFCVALLISPHHLPAGERGPIVFAAASLKTALDAVALDWQQKTDHRPVIVYGATSALARQITQGVEGDIFVSADRDWMDDLADRDLIDPTSRVDLVSNRLVLIVPKDSALKTVIGPNLPLERLLGDGRLAIAGVEAVPAGRYAKAALKNLGVWDQAKDRLAQVENVRAALRLVSRGETPLGIVYASDAQADPEVGVLGVFPENSHPAIVYPAAKLGTSASPQSNAFLAYLESPAARARFKENGFTVAPSESR